MNRTIDLVMRNLRTEVLRLVKQNEELIELNHMKDELITQQAENIKNLQRDYCVGKVEVKKNDRETS
jgi:hypothetical protein